MIEKIISQYSFEEAQKIKEAHNIATNAHQGQMRESGEPYITHPENVALILADMNMDYEAVCAALLHDVVEDTAITEEEIAEKFGNIICEIVRGVTKLNKIQFASKEEAQAENLRKMFLAMSHDIRVILVKLADRLHNMQTLSSCEESKQRRIAKETLDIYAPLANRLGIYQIKWRLEDLCLKYLEPEAYKYIQSAISEGRNQREEFIDEIISIINRKLVEDAIPAKVYGRPKHYYSIYKKMRQQGSDNLDNIYDLSAVRIIVTDVRYCYEALGIMHSEFIPMPGRFKDYIAMPKANMYQSLHTTVIGKNGKPFEIQIRTQEMHNTAEYGVAAHWKYKEGGGDITTGEEKLSWLRRMMDLEHEAKDSADFIDVVKTELFNDEVFVFTPKGDVKGLPMGATPLDFAYAVHSSIGHRCIGAKINGRIVNIDTKLKNGDIVEILTASKNAGHGPSRDWLNIVHTSEAKTKIRAWFKKELREENIEKGKEMLSQEAKRQGYQLSALTKPEWLDPLIKKYKIQSMEDLYASVGYGGLRVHQILPRLVEEYKKEHRTDKEEEKPKQEKKKERSTNGVIVKGESNMLVRFAKCCSPVPGDDIVGYITRGRGVSVHRRDCSNLGGFEHEREIPVSWDLEADTNYVANIQMHTYDRAGLIMELSNCIYSNKSDIASLNVSTKEGTGTITVGIRITDAKQLDTILKDIKKIQGVFEVYRLNN
ncbi:MAG: bifunctional (p)ppGpp synthetase/guanosine-3',5'-bis(diphosphate) 3'-pyrophosphohydrolase [Clostridiales bacterium]|nr:bifunctional (p)ppGpp synthetase/guanosine-3',5'-bis(diphosphate) 3'-pyrophosphohydrolase [Clostridiales bacterium]